VVGRRAPSLPTLRLDVAPALAAYARLFRLELEPQARGPLVAAPRRTPSACLKGCGRTAPARGCLKGCTLGSRAAPGAGAPGAAPGAPPRPPAARLLGCRPRGRAAPARGRLTARELGCEPPWRAQGRQYVRGGMGMHACGDAGWEQAPTGSTSLVTLAACVCRQRRDARPIRRPGFGWRLAHAQGEQCVSAQQHRGAPPRPNGGPRAAGPLCGDRRHHRGAGAAARAALTGNRIHGRALGGARRARRVCRAHRRAPCGGAVPALAACARGLLVRGQERRPLPDPASCMPAMAAR